MHTLNEVKLLIWDLSNTPLPPDPSIFGEHPTPKTFLKKNNVIPRPNTFKLPLFCCPLQKTFLNNILFIYNLYSFRSIDNLILRFVNVFCIFMYFYAPKYWKICGENIVEKFMESQEHP